MKNGKKNLHGPKTGVMFFMNKIKQKKKTRKIYIKKKKFKNKKIIFYK